MVQISDSHLGRVALLCAERQSGTNAILEYTEHLARALRNQSIDSKVVIWNGVRTDIRSYDTVVLQYNPFLYARRGFAAALVASLLGLQGTTPSIRLAMMVHEMYVPIVDWRTGVIGVAQRAQLRLLHSFSGGLFVSIQAWSDTLAEWKPLRAVAHLPVGSNLPDCRTQRAAGRDELKVRHGEQIVIAAFGTAHPSRLMARVISAANAVARQTGDVILLNLGANAPHLNGLDRGVRLVQPGVLPAEEVARLLSAADIFLAPFTDGVSTRRTSLMAAMQHELAVIGTDGHLTDDVLRRAPGLILGDVNDADAFDAAATMLAEDATQRAENGRAVRALYDDEFAWPVIAQRLRRGLHAL
jgi:glycosyltransferase involved in cell wall biosynthesis